MYLFPVLDSDPFLLVLLCLARNREREREHSLNHPQMPMIVRENHNLLPVRHVESHDELQNPHLFWRKRVHVVLFHEFFHRCIGLSTANQTHRHFGEQGWHHVFQVTRVHPARCGSQLLQEFASALVGAKPRARHGQQRSIFQFVAELAAHALLLFHARGAVDNAVGKDFSSTLGEH